MNLTVDKNWQAYLGEFAMITKKVVSRHNLTLQCVPPDDSRNNLKKQKIRYSNSGNNNTYPMQFVHIEKPPRRALAGDLRKPDSIHRIIAVPRQ